MNFQAECSCIPRAGGAVKDVSAEAFNKTFEHMSDAKQHVRQPTVVQRPAVNATAAIPKPISSASSAAATSTPTGTHTPKSTGSSIQIAVSTMVLAAISLGLAMI
ncbi:hypothetical protein CPC16_002194 [Podila verticillata]|nr:hypothetical protein CPC16_002194 [Podila verticillata]